MRQSALLLDRDGVINADRGYVHRVEDIVWQPGIFALARWATAKARPIVVITNQSGIGRGYYSEADFQTLTRWMCERFATEAAPVKAVYHAPWHPEATLAEYRVKDHPWRKPRPGMILAAAADLHLDLGRSVLVGDQWGDALAGASAGVGTLIVVGSPKGGRPSSLTSVHRLPTVADVTPWLTRNI